MNIGINSKVMYVGEHAVPNVYIVTGISYRNEDSVHITIVHFYDWATKMESPQYKISEPNELRLATETEIQDCIDLCKMKHVRLMPR